MPARTRERQPGGNGLASTKITRQEIDDTRVDPRSACPCACSPSCSFRCPQPVQEIIGDAMKAMTMSAASR